MQNAPNIQAAPAPDMYQNPMTSQFRMSGSVQPPYNQQQQMSNQNTVLISSTSNSLMSASVKPSSQQIGAIGTKVNAGMYFQSSLNSTENEWQIIFKNLSKTQSIYNFILNKFQVKLRMVNNIWECMLLHSNHHLKTTVIIQIQLLAKEHSLEMQIMEFSVEDLKHNHHQMHQYHRYN